MQARRRGRCDAAPTEGSLLQRERVQPARKNLGIPKRKSPNGGGAYAGSGEGSSAACHPRLGSLFLGSHLHRHRHMTNFEKQQICFCIPQAPLRPTKAYCFLHAAGLVKRERKAHQARGLRRWRARSRRSVYGAWATLSGPYPFGRHPKPSNPCPVVLNPSQEQTTELEDLGRRASRR